MCVCVCVCAYTRSGNTALHLAVYHDQTEMYDHLIEYCGASEHVRNNRGATPLLLAASLGKLDVFQHIYNRRRRVGHCLSRLLCYPVMLPRSMPRCKHMDPYAWFACACGTARAAELFCWVARVNAAGYTCVCVGVFVCVCLHNRLRGRTVQ